MKVISHGDTYEIFPDDIKTGDTFEAGTYVIRCTPQGKFSLQRISDFKQQEEKVYGDPESKIDKVMKAFNNFNRSLGVILSGDKGIGKSLFTQLLSERAIKKKDMPVFIVNKAYEGITDFIETIDQECIILFDEYEKMFKDLEGQEPQDRLLSLLDGSSQKKRLYVITVNDLHKVNSYMINRPGRFHYHFRFLYPNPSEILTYLTDKVDSKYEEEIKKVSKFGNRVQLNYDCLRAIAYELNEGYSFEETMGDLNIVNVEDARYDVEVHVNGKVEHFPRKGVDLFTEVTEIELLLFDTFVQFRFEPSELIEVGSSLEIEGSQVDVTPLDWVDQEESLKVSKLVFKQAQTKNLHYVG